MTAPGVGALPDILDVIHAQPREKTAMILDQRVVSFGELADRVSAISRQLDDVPTVVAAADSIETAIYWLACYHRGVTCALIDPAVFAVDRAKIDQAIHYGQLLTDGRILGRDGSRTVRPDPRDRAEWVAPSASRFERQLILASSRSTGDLKLIVHDNAMLARHHEFWVRNHPLQDGDLVAAPRTIPFGYGFIVVLTWALWSGKGVSFVSNRGQNTSVHMRVTVSALTLPELRKLAIRPKLRLAVSAGAMIHSDMWSWFRETYPGVTLANMVGATENLTCYLYSNDETTFRPYPGYQCRAVDDNGIHVVGRPGYFEYQGFITPQYLNAPALQTSVVQDGWVRLGDYAIDNGDGTFKFLGRTTISFDLENALRADPRISDCHFTAVNGAPVLLVATESASVEDVAEIASRFAIRLPQGSIILRRGIPRNENGKVPKEAVAHLVQRIPQVSLPAKGVAA